MRKTCIILLLFPFMLACVTPPATKCRDFGSASFALKISLTERETSKDSHWIRFDVTVANRNACWSAEGGGFRSEGRKGGSCRLDDEAFDQLRKYIGVHIPLRDILETMPSGGLGRSVFLHMEISMDGKTTKADVSGMLNDWSRRYNGQEWNIRNIGLVNHARSIISMIQSASK